MKIQRQNEAETRQNRKGQYCTFHLSERMFGVNIKDVKEINGEKAFTPIYHAPKEVKGYVNIRGQIYLILDLKLLMGLANTELSPDSRLILFKPNVLESVGVLVDKVGDVVEVDEEQIEDRRKSGNGARKGTNNRRNRLSSSISAGVCKLKDQLMVIVLAKNLLKEIRGKYD